MTYDVVVVGAGIAGATAAILYGRAGLRVALLERRRDITTYKQLCGHCILSGTYDVLQRTHLWKPMVDAGAWVGRLAGWNREGWMVAADDVPPTICLRRERLDPLLRRLAADTPGVDLILGHRVVELLSRDDRCVGVRATDGTDADHEFRGALVIGADGHLSPVAALAGAATDTAPNNRFAMWAYYRDVRYRAPADTVMWQLDPELAFLVPDDDGLITLATYPTRARLAEFRADGFGALERFFRDLPEGPDLTQARRASKLLGMTNYPCISRDPTPAPGLMLIGDAALTSDPATGVGCGYAFRTAEWLVNSTLPALRGTRSMRWARARYRRELRFIMRHDRFARKQALAPPVAPIERVFRRAAVVDEEVGRRIIRVAMRVDPVSRMFSPATMARALLASRRHSTSAAEPDLLAFPSSG